jgi:hypothetical protein
LPTIHPIDNGSHDHQKNQAIDSKAAARGLRNRLNMLAVEQLAPQFLVSASVSARVLFFFFTSPVYDACAQKRELALVAGRA